MTATRLPLFVLLSALAACEVEGGEGGGWGDGGESEYEGGGEDDDDDWSDDGGSSGGGSGGGGSSSGCNDANEDCSPGTCGGEGSTMLPGSNCLACHTGGEPGEFTVAGTVFADLDGSGKVSGATIYVTDADGQSFTLTSNSVGNFYTTRSVSLPLTVEVENDGFTMAMGSAASTGACNTCHQCDGSAGGKLYAE